MRYWSYCLSSITFNVEESVMFLIYSLELPCKKPEIQRDSKQ